MPSKNKLQLKKIFWGTAAVSEFYVDDAGDMHIVSTRLAGSLDSLVSMFSGSGAIADTEGDSQGLTSLTPDDLNALPGAPAGPPDMGMSPHVEPAFGSPGQGLAGNQVQQQQPVEVSHQPELKLPSQPVAEARPEAQSASDADNHLGYDSELPFNPFESSPVATQPQYQQPPQQPPQQPQPAATQPGEQQQFLRPGEPQYQSYQQPPQYQPQQLPESMSQLNPFDSDVPGDCNAVPIDYSSPDVSQPLAAEAAKFMADSHDQPTLETYASVQIEDLTETIEETPVPVNPGEVPYQPDVNPTSAVANGFDPRFQLSAESQQIIDANQIQQSVAAPGMVTGQAADDQSSESVGIPGGLVQASMPVEANAHLDSQQPQQPQPQQPQGQQPKFETNQDRLNFLLPDFRKNLDERYASWSVKPDRYKRNFITTARDKGIEPAKSLSDDVIKQMTGETLNSAIYNIFLVMTVNNQIKFQSGQN